MTPNDLQRFLDSSSLSVQRFAREIGVARGTVYAWLSGTNPIPKYVELLCECLSKGKPPTRR